MVFAYRARNLSGKLFAGRVEAENQAAALALLREKNLFVLELKPARIFSFNLRPAGKIKTRALAVFCRQFATMSEAGLPLLPCLNILVQQTEDKALGKILREVAAAVEKGKSLSDAFKEHRRQLPPILINMLVAGEVSGTLDQALRRLAIHFEKEHELREKIKSAMTYPLLVAGMALVAMVFLMIFVVPIFVELFTGMGAQLPLPTRLVLGVSNLLTRYWYLLLLLLGALYFAFRRAAAGERGKEMIDRLLMRLPVAGPLTRKTLVARFARTLATLLRSGVPLLLSLETVENVAGNMLAAREIAAARENIREGERMAPVFSKSKFLSPMDVSMMAVGEESGALDDLLEKLAVFHEQEVETMVARLSSTLEPLLIAGVGVMVAFIALSIYLPLFGMAGAIQGGSGVL